MEIATQYFPAKLSLRPSRYGTCRNRLSTNPDEYEEPPPRKPIKTKTKTNTKTNPKTNPKPKIPLSNVKSLPTNTLKGAMLGDLYKLQSILSDEDNGMVFSAVRRIDNYPVAIKSIKKDKVLFWHKIRANKKIPMEIALLRKVNAEENGNGHIGIVKLLACFECSDCYLLIMARPTPAMDLFEYIRSREFLDEETSKIIFIQVVHAMIHCQKSGVFHRDIKPENILIHTKTLNTTVIDFGCGTHLTAKPYKEYAGTLFYSPPEFYVAGQYHGSSSTVWSLGILLYVMLCGQNPFYSADEIVHGKISWPCEFGKNFGVGVGLFGETQKISFEAMDLVEKMVDKNPTKRMRMSEILLHPWLKNTVFNKKTGRVTVDVSEKSCGDFRNSCGEDSEGSSGVFEETL